MWNFSIPQFSLRKIFNNSTIATVFLVVMCIQIVAIEGYGISPVKVVLMGLAPLFFIFKVPFVNSALLWGMLYWLFCYFSASFNGDMRFSTIGYLGMFIVSYIVFYNLVYCGAFTLESFIKLLRGLIIAYGIALVLQQLSILVGIRSLWLINLDNQFFLSLTKLPSLSLEPSHSARLLTVMMLCYLRCYEIINNGVRITLPVLFERQHRVITILFLWTMLTMGSGTAFIGLGLLSLYFIQRKTAVYVIPSFMLLFYIGQSSGFEQMDRAVRVTQAAMTGNVEIVQETDGSAASRVIPLINTLTQIDLFEKETWMGKGTSSHEQAMTGWKRTTDKIAVVEQYGYIALILSLLLVYRCSIRKFFSLETLFFLILLGFSLGNIAYGWGIMMLFACVRYFQEKHETKNSIAENERDRFDIGDLYV